MAPLRCTALLMLLVLTTVVNIGEAVFQHTWIKRADLPNKRSDFTATTVTANGKSTILLVGGCVSNQTWIQDPGMYGCGEVSNLTVSYDPATDTYKTQAAAPRPRYRHGAAAVGSKVYLFGGVDVTDALVTAIDVFDAASGSWSTLPDAMPDATTDLCVASNGTDVYVMGGYTPPDYTSSKSLRRFDTLTSVWSIKTDMTQDRGDCAATSLDGKIYVYGGFHVGNGFAMPTPSMEVYDVATNKWSNATAAKVGRGDTAVIAFNGHVVVIGGETKDSKGNSVPLQDVEVYSPVYNNWTNIGDIPSRRFRFVAASFGADRSFVFGGQGYLVGTPSTAGSYYPVLGTVEEFDEIDPSSSSSPSVSFQASLLLLPMLGLLVAQVDTRH